MDIKRVFYQILLLVVFNFFGLLLNFISKIVMRVKKFNFPIMVTILTQSKVFWYNATGIVLISSLLIQINKCRNKQQQNEEQQQNDSFLSKLNRQKWVIVLSLLYIMNGICSIYAINIISIPIYLAFKRCSVVFVILMKLCLGQFNQITKSMLISSIIICGSTLAATLDDLENGTTLGYTVLVVSNLGIVFYAELSRSLQKDQKIDSNALLQQNCGYSSILIFPFTFIFKDFQLHLDFMRYEVEEQIAIEIVLLMLMYVIVNYGRQFFLFLCTKNIDVYTIKLSGNFKDLIGTIISMIFFNDINLSSQVIVSLVISFIGAFGYCVAQNFENQQKKQNVDNDSNQIILMTDQNKDCLQKQLTQSLVEQNTQKHSN